MKSLRIEVFGLVQGVGFRPFIYNLALRFGIFGRVFNDCEGVKIDIYAKDEICDQFCKAIFDELPPLARIDDFKVLHSELKFDTFKIVNSQFTQKLNPILPDFAICDECKAEFYDHTNPRYHHPFINCTNCGPRFSIIKSLPYDRKNTTMKNFKMCDKCETEYKDPLNRRYHAQPIACNACGPKVYLKDMSEEILAKNEEAVKLCATWLKKGKIIAIKGIGGFHLVCRADDSEVLRTLRQKKQRPSKPFAIMCKDEKMALKYAKFSKKELELLNSNIKPIVLASNLNALPEELAPGLQKIGIFLAPTALHLLLFEYIDFPIVATSANISGEPIITNSIDIVKKLGGVVHLILDNDREIINPSDDSIAFFADDRLQWIRTSRGIKPKIIRSKFSQKGCFLALGGELKNQFAIYKDGLIFSSVYIGDLKNIATFERFLNLVEKFSQTYDFKFDFIIGDLHPHFLHTKYFEKQGFKLYKAQHHWAHLLSVMIENDISSEVLGVAFDGTGYGDDGEIWGGELFLCDQKGYKRILHFDEFELIGGDKSIKNIYYLTYAILRKYDIDAPEFKSRFDEKTLLNLDKVLSRNINLVKTSSLGRIFDAFACLALKIDTVSYDAQAAMSLEALYDENLDISYKFEIENDVITYKDVFLNALSGSPRVLATGFINGLADLILSVALMYKKPLVLSGGVFQNRALLTKTISNLKQAGITFYLPKDEPANDSGLAMGQIYYGLNFLGYNSNK